MILRVFLANLPFAAPVFASAAESAVVKSPPPIDMIQWFGGLIVVLGAVLVLAWGLRRLGSFSRLEAGRFQVLGALSLGARERVVLLQVGEKQLVLGVAPGRVQALCLLSGEEAIKIGSVVSAGGSQDSFAERLATLLARKRT